MKKIIVLCMMLMLAGGLAFSQAQDPGFSNTVYTGFGNVDPLANKHPKKNETDFVFQGIASYFTANLDIGKLTIAGDILWKMGFDPFVTGIYDLNFNVVMKPFTGFDVGLGTNLDWKVGPAPSSGPLVSAYNVPYYAGLDALLLPSAGKVENAFADRGLAVRYAFEDLIQVGFSLADGSTEDSFFLGIGVKANIMDLFTIGFAYNGDFKTSDNNSIYIGSTISAIKTVPIDIWLNFVPNGKDNKAGNNTIGGRVGFTLGAFYLAPEFSVTIWNSENTSPSMYIALDTYMSITNSMLLGLDASWGLGSNKLTNIDDTHAGARLNINPYFIWNLNEANKLSIGVHIMPIWWQAMSGDNKADVFWSIPIAWKVTF